jgi:pantetheine-phosphate adenylyltransferase
MNHKLNKNFETVFLMAEIENQIISSNFVKEIAVFKRRFGAICTKHCY